ncbi:MAG: DUF4012 domain-containing protein [bacterium]|nr:DUF4012 domain-containing protein [bacterium]
MSSIDDITPPENDGSPLENALQEIKAERARKGIKPNTGPRNVWMFAAGFAVFGIATFWFYFTQVSPVGNNSGRSPLDLGRFQNEFLPKIRSGIDAYKGFNILSGGGAEIVGDIGAISELLPELFAHKRGEDFLVLLKRIDKNLGIMQDALNGIDVSLQDLESQLPFDVENALSFRLQLIQAKQFLGLAIPWFEDAKPHHIAVFFANTSEMRPAGGFLGSYADLEIADASVAAFTVHDINDVDRLFKPNFVPPVPLQGLEKAWRIADANWFFDVPTSARKVLDFMDMSDLSKASSTHFEGAIFISPRVVGDLLALTGPIELKNASVTITTDNFLKIIQGKVQVGQESRDPYPKKILSELAPLILEKITRLAEGEQGALLENAIQWINARDLLVYAGSSELQGMLDNYNVSGRAFVPQGNFKGDYLAVVNANIGGGKTDLYMKQSVSFESQLDIDGTVSNHLTITRTHTAPKNAEWWYRVPNISYQTMYVPSNAKFIYGKSSLERHVVPLVNYKKSGFEIDPDIAALESTSEEIPAARAFTRFSLDAKSIFATWSKTDVGKTSTTTLDYTRRLPDTLGEGSVYTFVLERAQGDEGSYHLSIAAPAGYVWQEVNLPVFDYKEETVPGRVTFTLTLHKI